MRKCEGIISATIPQGLDWIIASSLWNGAENGAERSISKRVDDI
jgi:hypothetical protein